MKKITLALAFSAVTVSFGAVAQTDICTGTAGPGTKPTGHTAGTNFMVVDISPQCSANVFLKGQDGTSGAWYAVGAVSSKGKNAFGGSTNGGAVRSTAACAVPGGCTASEAASALSTANTAAGSSS